MKESVRETRVGTILLPSQQQNSRAAARFLCVRPVRGTRLWLATLSCLALSACNGDDPTQPLSQDDLDGIWEARIEKPFEANEPQQLVFEIAADPATHLATGLPARERCVIPGFPSTRSHAQRPSPQHRRVNLRDAFCKCLAPSRKGVAVEDERCVSVRVKELPPRAPLPARAGVGPRCVALPKGPWLTMSEFLCQRFPGVPRDVWLRRMAGGDVVDQLGLPVDATRRFEPHMRLYYYRATSDEPRLPFVEHVVHQDDDLIVADKPHFLPVVPSGPYLHETLLVRLKQRLGIDTLVPVHRIDRETAGLVMFSVRPATRDAYQRLFRDQRIEKIYQAIVPFQAGRELPSLYRSRLVNDTKLRMREQSGTPNAETHLQLLESCGAFARVQLAPRSGRKHQLRVHCAALGMPIVGDRIYPELMPFGEDDLDRPLQLLAKALAFRDPVTGRSRSFSSSRELQLPGVLAP